MYVYKRYQCSIKFVRKVPPKTTLGTDRRVNDDVQIPPYSALLSVVLSLIVHLCVFAGHGI